MRIAPIVLSVVLSGCAAGAGQDAPSLMPRSIESRSDAEPTATVQVAATDAALDAQIASRVAAFGTAAKAFETARPGVASRIGRAKGAAEGSERWLDAQSAMGELQQARTATDGAMAELEALAIERATAGAPPYPALETALAAAQAELDRQLAAEAALKAQLGG